MTPEPAPTVVDLAAMRESRAAAEKAVRDAVAARAARRILTIDDLDAAVGQTIEATSSLGANMIRLLDAYESLRIKVDAMSSVMLRLADLLDYRPPACDDADGP